MSKRLKKAAPRTSVIVLSAITEVADKVLLLELGADDYVTKVTKPFSPLLARLVAVTIPPSDPDATSTGSPTGMVLFRTVPSQKTKFFASGDRKFPKLTLYP